MMNEVNEALVILGIAEITSALLHVMAMLMIRSFEAPKGVKAAILGFFATTAATQAGLGIYWILHAHDPYDPLGWAEWVLVASMVLRAYSLNSLTGMCLAWLWHRDDE